MRIDINIALQYLIDNQAELYKADEDLIDSVEVLLTLVRWEKDDIARIVESYDGMHEELAEAGDIDPELLLQQSEEYEKNITQLRPKPPEDIQ